jgi:tRNA dimethylallyltransferase
VDDQLRRGLVDEARALVDAGVPTGARPFGSLGYRQVLEHLRGVRGQAETRELIVRETRKYARRQLIWFRKEPNLDRIAGPGELPSTIASACRLIDRRLRTPEPGAGDEETS